MGIDILTLAAARAGKCGGSASKYKQPEWGVEEGNPVSVVSEATVSVAYISNYGRAMGQTTINASDMAIGDLAKVIYDGNEYEVKVTAGMNPGTLNIGEGDPFMMVYTPATGALQMVTTDKADAEHRIAISYIRDVYHPIPHDYLPGSAPNVLIVTADASGVTDIPSQNVNAVLSAGGLAYLKMPGTNSGETVILPCVGGDGVHAAFAGVIYANSVVQYIAYDHNGTKIAYKHPRYIDMETDGSVYRVAVNSSGDVTATKQA